MPLFYADPKNAPVRQQEVLGTHLATRFPNTWQRDRGITRVESEEWGSPGAGFDPSQNFVTKGPFAGYSKTAVGLSLREARKKLSEGTRQMTRAPVGGASVQPPVQHSMMFGGGGAPSRYAPKRLWNYQLANIAPSNTTLGRMRSMFSGFSSPVFRR